MSSHYRTVARGKILQRMHVAVTLSRHKNNQLLVALAGVNTMAACWCSVRKREARSRNLRAEFPQSRVGFGRYGQAI